MYLRIRRAFVVTHSDQALRRQPLRPCAIVLVHELCIVACVFALARFRVSGIHTHDLRPTTSHREVGLSCLTGLQG